MSSAVNREVFRRPEWWELPEELLELVLKNLPGFSDCVRFRSVCREWRSLADPHSLPTQLPLLMLPYHPLAAARSFFCPATGKSFDVSLPELVGKAVLASSFGWMVLLDINAKALSLLNPVTRAQIELPPTDGFHQLLDLRLASDGSGLRIAGYDGVPLSAMEFWTLCRWEVSLSSRPSSGEEECVVVVSDTSKVYFCKPGEKAWSSLSHQSPPRSALYHDGRLYVMSANAELSVFDAATLSTLKTIPTPVRSEAIHRYFFSLAKKNSSELIFFAGNPNIVHERDPFQIFKIDMGKEDGQLEWSSISNLQEMPTIYWSMKQCMVVNGGGDIPASMKGRIYFDGAPYKHEVNNEPSHQISICSIKDVGESKVLGCGGEKPSEKLMKPAWITLSLS